MRTYSVRGEGEDAKARARYGRQQTGMESSRQGSPEHGCREEATSNDVATTSVIHPSAGRIGSPSD